MMRGHVSVRYKQTVLGSAWAVIQPLTMMVIFTVVFGQIALEVPHDDVPPLRVCSCLQA